jgi:peptidoglycan/LPS O-acetylase OafA/YrhL
MVARMILNKEAFPVGSESRIRELDGFRGCAVLAIVFLHYVVHHLQTTPGTIAAYAQKCLTFLWVGVDGFFVLSGLLIGGILMDRKRAPNFFKVFYLRRSLRIFPPYFLLLFAWAAACGVRDSPGMNWILDPRFPAWPYFLYAQNFWMVADGSGGPMFVAATWSLAVEEQFYLLFPLIVWWCSASALPVVLCAGIVLAPTLRVCMAFLGPEWQLAQTLLLPSRWDSLLLGALVAWLVRDPRALAWLKAHRRTLLVLLVNLGAFMLLLPLLFRDSQPTSSPSGALFAYLGVAAFFALVLLMLHLGALPRTAVALSSGPLRFFGRISYFMYLFHTAILGLAFALLLGKEPILEGWIDWCVTVGAFGLTVALALVSWRWFESPLVGSGHRFKYDSPVDRGRVFDK